MEAEQYKHSEMTKKIIGAAMKVHTWFGPGFPEIIYQRALLIELEKLGLSSESEVEREVYYEEAFVGKRRLDVIVENVVLLELKALSEVDAACYAKILNYLKIFKIEVGLLLNFGAERLQFKRLVR